MTDQVLNVLKVALLALVYLFFARVLWAVWSEVRTPVVADGLRVRRERNSGITKRQRAPRGATSFVVMEPRDLRGQRFVLSSTLGIGRSEENDICVNDDTFASQNHARIEMRADAIWVVDLGSTNGTFVNGQRVTTDKSMRKSDRLQVGSTVLEMH
ncbi:MAG: FHA domain-containing protein [Ilumatobacteraceae bacterium]|nr:FHA domain-containing protein [Ilumatobacteraceae bacterium]